MDNAHSSLVAIRIIITHEENAFLELVYPSRPRDMYELRPCWRHRFPAAFAFLQSQHFV